MAEAIVASFIVVIGFRSGHSQTSVGCQTLVVLPSGGAVSCDGYRVAVVRVPVGVVPVMVKAVCRDA